MLLVLGFHCKDWVNSGFIQQDTTPAADTIRTHDPVITNTTLNNCTILKRIPPKNERRSELSLEVNRIGTFPGRLCPTPSSFLSAFLSPPSGVSRVSVAFQAASLSVSLESGSRVGLFIGGLAGPARLS
ncbi:hypothetical protein PoB_003292800 [Plakobranchus ocellatus]|uniref:Uncharacterized protein n=1 Tax=Plakobranchus ocellatus TaxID=259542 RepID=A0AAV4AHZ2_9GAST|nr:hypothetical protein PoB_003292800 [Plakobranchus ocellatus]